MMSGVGLLLMAGFMGVHLATRARPYLSRSRGEIGRERLVLEGDQDALESGGGDHALGVEPRQLLGPTPRAASGSICTPRVCPATATRTRASAIGATPVTTSIPHPHRGPSIEGCTRTPKPYQMISL